MIRRVTLLVCLLPGLLACSDRQTAFSPRSFDRPGAIAFTCFDESLRVFVPRDQCRRATRDGNFSLTALVAQTGRGEVAAIDLTEERIIDADLRVPGFTFHAVGETPIALVLRDEAPEYTYVATFGSRRIEAIPTDRFRPDAADRGLEEHFVDLPAGATDLVLSRAGAEGEPRFLFAPIPQAGIVVQIPIGADGRIRQEDVREFALEVPEITAPDPDEPATALISFPELPPVDLAELETLPVTADPRGYEKLCAANGPADVPAATLQPPSLAVGRGRSTRPVALLVDGLRLLVADEALPVIHVVSLGAAGIQPLAEDPGVADAERIAVGVPTRALALSPRVPEALLADPMTAPARYLYAIDAIDQSILVVDYERTSPSFGAVLPVGYQVAPVDRIRYPGGVRTIEVITPGSGGELCTGPESEFFANAGPLQLRGVFLAAGLNDGSVRLIDIHDLDAPCRGGVECRGPSPNPNDVFVHIRRHRPRIGAFHVNPIAATGTPTFTIDGRTARVTPDGRIETIPGAGLAALTACPPGMTRIYPLVGGAGSLICALNNVWTVRPEPWVAVWNGVIPGATGRQGRVDGTTFVARGTNLCGRGVLGAENAAAVAEGPEAAYAGDDLVVVSDLPAGTRDNAACAREFDRERFPRFAFPIRVARTVAGNGGIETILELEQAPDGPSLALLDTCFPEFVDYEIRTQGAFVVNGGQTGFLHRVTTGEDGSCLVDETRPPTLNGRAIPGETFANTVIAFRPLALPPLDEDDVPLRYRTAQLDFSIGNVPGAIVARPGDIAGRPVPVLPTTLRFNTIDQRLYLVDQASRGVVQFGARPFRILRTFE